MNSPSDRNAGVGTAVDAGEPIVREIHIRATPETVFEFFTDPGKLTRWLATEATLDPRPGEIRPPERVVFTWGFTDPDVGVPPGSSVVDVTLTPDGGGTRLRLEHRDLPVPAIESHAGGWTGMLERLATAVVGTAREEP
jgi:uncharacterized protein YndB with AHSA1/START domain